MDKAARAALLTAKGMDSNRSAYAEGGGKKAYHATQEPFENYDWNRLGQTTKDNTSGTSVDDWASSLANLGPWSHEKPLSKKLGMKTDLPVMLTGKEKKFKSLDHLAQEISRHGGPTALREKLVSQGYGHASVDDEEFGGKSYVGLSPEHFKITKSGGGSVDTKSENIADYVADLLRQGRASEVTDDLMEQADPQRLMHHYTSGNTGMNLPMDYASRMERAAKMGFDAKSYHGTGKSFPHFDPALGGTGAIRGNPIAKEGIFTSQMPAMADRYAEQGAGYQKYNEGGNNIPLMTKLATSSVPLQSAKPEDLQNAKQQGHASVNLNVKEEPWETVTFDPTNIRSQFARFDPRLDHLAHLSASTGGAMEFARHVEAVNRAGGQIAPSKYLPNVPRAVHAGGGKVDFTRDNPGGEWLEGKQARAAQHPNRKFMTGSITGVIGGRSDVFLPTHILKGIAGLNDEVRTTGIHKYDSLLSDAQKGGFDPDQQGNKVVVAVNHYGQPYLLEGNTRVAVAHTLGIPKVKAEVRYWNGAENVDGPMHPEKVFGMASANPDITKADGGDVEGDEDGITAYHGSPHSFDQFDISKLGTGEGNQAYGHGLYFAGNEGIAKHYRDTLSDPYAPLGAFKTNGNREMDILHMPDGIYSLLNDRHQNTDYGKLMSAAQEKLQWAQTRKGPMRDTHSKKAQDVIDFLKANEGMRFEQNPARGHMYKVKLHVKPEELLDWDKPLSADAPQSVKDAFNNVANSDPVLKEKFYKAYKERQPGSIYYSILSDHARTGNWAKNQAFASSKLQEAGLKGIRYLDAGSRDLSDGDPTHNYVMFHHDPVQVVDKYEYGGTVAVPKAHDVSAALALTRRFTKDGTGATLALKSKGK
jgi:hypothetical protein